MDLNELVGENQSIKIIPSVEDTLRSKGLNVDLDDNTKLWFDQLKATWKTWKKSLTSENHIEMFFNSVPDPYRIALVFIINCDEYKDCKPKTLPYFIMEVLQKWAHTKGILPDDTLKLPAFHIATQQRSQHFISLVVKTYQVSTIKEIVIPMLWEMIKNDNCRLACQIVMAMELYEDIPVQNLLFPFVIQDKTFMIDEYLTESPNQVKPFLLFLDSLLDKNFNIREYVQNYIEENRVYYIRYEKLHHKPLGKLVARLCNKFNIPIETCKNLSKNRTTGGLRYLIHQKYQEHKVSSSVWDDLVKDSLRQNSESAKEFIDMLVDYDRKEAIKWAQFLNMTESELPLALHNMSLEDTEEVEECWDTPTCQAQQKTAQNYYKLPISEDNIILVDTSEKFYDMMMGSLADCSIVSIDCEWKPSFGAAQSRVALIQIATDKNVYLLDTLILNTQQYISFWYNFQKTLIDNAEIIKLGFGLEQDLKEMRAVVGLHNLKHKGEGLLDLSLLWKNLIDIGIALPSNCDSGSNSLSSLVQCCFGLPLEKSEQCSNWELRPLRKTQMQYAALDAYVLLQIYYYLQKMCENQGINFEEICNDIMLEGKKKSVKKSKVDKLNEVCTRTHSVREVKLLVEPELFSLMFCLRYCGLDTMISPTNKLWYEIINTAISEDRRILVSKMKYTPTENYPQKNILDLSKGSDREKLHKMINSFNIIITQNDLLSRCINCNGTDLTKLSSNEVLNICNDYPTPNPSINNQRGSKYDYDDIEDDYESFLSDSECEEATCQPIHTIDNAKKCTTKTGVPININDVNKLSATNKPGILCESCGKLFWDEDDILKPVIELIFSITRLRIW